MGDVCRDPRLLEYQKRRYRPPVRGGHRQRCAIGEMGAWNVCGKPTVWTLRYHRVWMHVCDAHKFGDAMDLDAALRSLGWEETSDRKDPRVACRDQPPCDSLIEDEDGSDAECNLPSTWAALKVDKSFECDLHAKRFEKAMERLRAGAPTVTVTGRKGRGTGG